MSCVTPIVFYASNSANWKDNLVLNTFQDHFMETKDLSTKTAMKPKEFDCARRVTTGPLATQTKINGINVRLIDAGLAIKDIPKFHEDKLVSDSDIKILKEAIAVNSDALENTVNPEEHTCLKDCSSAITILPIQIPCKKAVAVVQAVYKVLEASVQVRQGKRKLSQAVVLCFGDNLRPLDTAMRHQRRRSDDRLDRDKMKRSQAAPVSLKRSKSAHNSDDARAAPPAHITSNPSLPSTEAFKRIRTKEKHVASSKPLVGDDNKIQSDALIRAKHLIKVLSAKKEISGLRYVFIPSEKKMDGINSIIYDALTFSQSLPRV